MTDDEKAEWLGEPKSAVGANLLTRSVHTVNTVNLDCRLDHIVATATLGGIFQYGIIILGPAYDFEGKTVTLSVDSVAVSNGGYARIGLFWRGPNGVYTSAGVQINAAGSVTGTLTENTQNLLYLAAFVYVSTGVSAEIGTTVRYNGVMLEYGNVRHPFVPYTEIVATPATKGAYNYSDLNRVETAVSELSDLYGLGLTTKTNWSAYDIPTVQDMDRYLSNIRRIRTIAPNQSDLPTLPTDMRRMTYETANSIEKILVAAYEGAAGSYRSGEIYSGEV